MSEELMIPTPGQLQVSESKFATSDALVAVSGSSYLPYVILGYGTTKQVQEGKVQLGHYGLVKGASAIDLGTKFQLVCFGWRPRAIDFSNNVSVFDPNHPEFTRFVSEAKAAPKGQASGYAYGAEYLVYVLGDVKELALFMFGNKSLRIASPSLSALLSKQDKEGQYLVVDVGTTLVDNSNNQKFTAPVITQSESMLTDFPDQGTLAKVLEEFNNPPAITQETVEEDSRER